MSARRRFEWRCASRSPGPSSCTAGHAAWDGEANTGFPDGPTREKTITVFNGVVERARKLYRLPANPVADVEKPRTATRTEIQVFSPEEVMALVRAADFFFKQKTAYDI